MTASTKETYTIAGYAALVRLLPVIHVVVSPVPPRDYVVDINGKEYPASVESKYGVRPGLVVLIVRRKSLKPCVHKIVVEKNETVRCKL
jgi:hypothetical protein